jgi:hypothetical protein
MLKAVYGERKAVMESPKKKYGLLTLSITLVGVVLMATTASAQGDRIILKILSRL